MSNAKLDFPPTEDWLTYWAQSETILSYDSLTGSTTNPQKFVIESPSEKDWNMMMSMSLKKVVANNISSYYWGYTAQVNSKVAPVKGNII
jgi:hypothetical protein